MSTSPDTTADRSAVTAVVDRLGACLDEGRFDDLRALVVEDATVRTPGGQAEGREALIAQARRNHPSDQRFHHVITNVLVDLDGDRASVRANLVLHVTTPAPDDAPTDAPAPPPVYVLGEVYRFELARTEDGWRFTHIATTPVWLSGTRPPVTRAA